VLPRRASIVGAASPTSAATPCSSPYAVVLVGVVGRREPQAFAVGRFDGVVSTTVATIVARIF